MLEKLTIPGVEVPNLYVASTKVDVNLAMENGIPFIVWKKGSKDLIKHMLRPALEKMFPYIIWDKVLGERSYESKIVMKPGCECNLDNEEKECKDDGWVNVAEDERLFKGACNACEYEEHDLKDYLGDVNSMVNIDVLQELHLMPKFIGDIVDCIRVNLVTPVHWTEGYNKKLGAPLGTFSRSKQLPNLIILDVSGSIPRGIAATMITLIDTLRTQLSAELIITSTISRYYALDEELPSPQSIRNIFGFNNESEEFERILRKRIAGKEWGNVISFGDNDTPWLPGDFLGNTIVHSVRHYHTGILNWDGNKKTGYAKWCSELTKTKPEIYTDTSWCNVIVKDY